MPSGHGYIDLAGKLVIPTPHTNLFRFNEGFVRLRLAEGGWAFIDPQGKEQLRVERAMSGFSDGLALTGKGFVNPQGTVVLPVQFLSNFTRYGTRFGYLHPDGSWALEPRFTMAQPFAEGRAAVAFDT